MTPSAAKSPDTVRYTAYDHTRFPAHLPFARNGYLFTLSGDFPEDTPAHTKVTDSEMAVYRKDGDWEVRDVNGNRKVWGVGSTRAGAVRAAFAVVYRERTRDAARVADKRRAAGLEAIPPYQVEIVSSVTLVLHPTTTAVLDRVVPGDGPARYRVRDIGGGEPYEVQSDDVVWHTVTTGILHERCGHQPKDARRFENEQEAAVYAAHGLTRSWMCPDNPDTQE